MHELTITMDSSGETTTNEQRIGFDSYEEMQRTRLCVGYVVEDIFDIPQKTDGCFMFLQ